MKPCLWIGTCIYVVLFFSVYLFLVFVVPFFLIWSIGSTDVLTCKRLASEPPVCQHQTWRLLGLHYASEEWQLQKVAVAESYNEGVTYSLALTTSQKEVQLSYYSDNREKVYQDFTRLNNFLGDRFERELYLNRHYGIFQNVIIFIASIFTLAFSAPFIWLLLFISKAGFRYVKSHFRFSR